MSVQSTFLTCYLLVQQQIRVHDIQAVPVDNIMLVVLFLRTCWRHEWNYVIQWY
jgi:kynurenine formamidase